MKKLLLIILVFCSFAATAQVSTTVSTSASDSDGVVTAMKMELISGTASAVSIATPTSTTGVFKSLVTFTQVGIYGFQITAMDNDGDYAIPRQFSITVTKNKPPVINIISNQTLRTK